MKNLPSQDQSILGQNKEQEHQQINISELKQYQSFDFKHISFMEKSQPNKMFLWATKKRLSFILFCLLAVTFTISIIISLKENSKMEKNLQDLREELNRQKQVNHENHDNYQLYKDSLNVFKRHMKEQLDETLEKTFSKSLQKKLQTLLKDNENQMKRLQNKLTDIKIQLDKSIAQNKRSNDSNRDSYRSEENERKGPSENTKRQIFDLQAIELMNIDHSGSGPIIAEITEGQRLFAGELLQLKYTFPPDTNKLTTKQQKYYQKKYKINDYQELPFCIVIPSYNNAPNDRHIKNINSILMQNYINYDIIFIDDASTDNTAIEVSNILKNQVKVPESRYKIIRNDVNKKAMYNLRRAARQFCKIESIFMVVDGDDELVGRQVLKLFNSIFQQEKMWFVYSNFINFPGLGTGFSRPVDKEVMRNNEYRYFGFFTSHLRAFYTKLFLNIEEEDLQDNKGAYFIAANDVAICLPILEQSHQRVRYLPEVTYLYNSKTGINNHEIHSNEQGSNDVYIRTKKVYMPLETIDSKPKYKLSTFI